MNIEDLDILVRSLATRVAALERANIELEALTLNLQAIASYVGTPGTGACICDASPERIQAYAQRIQTNFDICGVDLNLDHRCPHHGEKAQPMLWGRHKDKKLTVTPAQWLSLGVTR